MARYRRNSRRRREPMNTEWQPICAKYGVQIAAGTLDTVVNGILNPPGLVNDSGWLPGIGYPQHSGVDTFDDQHILERIRGSMCHNGIIGVQPTEETLWFPFSIAAIRIPNGMAVSELNLFDNSDADDFFFRMDAVCNISRSDAIPNWHEVDSKSKRRFEVGDKFAMLYSLLRPTDSAFTLDVTFNLRFLWRLRN